MGVTRLISEQKISTVLLASARTWSSLGFAKYFLCALAHHGMNFYHERVGAGQQALGLSFRYTAGSSLGSALHRNRVQLFLHNWLKLFLDNWPS